MKVVGFIPARYASMRFPAKPLADINGYPMIWRVYHQALKCNFDEIHVLTESEIIIKECNKHNIPVLLTRDTHPTGTDRVAEAINYVDADLYITMQGDEPLMEPKHVNMLIDKMKNDSTIVCATTKTKYTNPVDIVNGTTPKVVCDMNDNILYFSRSPIPYPKGSLDYSYYKPMGLYGFRKDILKLYGTLDRSPLEKIEDIELLRLVEHGIKIKIFEVDSDTIAVDTPKDLERVRALLKENT